MAYGLSVLCEPDEVAKGKATLLAGEKNAEIRTPMVQPVDHVRCDQRTPQFSGGSRIRRHGKELEHALYAATLAELTALGYGRLTMEGIAARARTGKAALYRRWPDKHALVLAALRHALPPPPQPRAHRSARQQLMAEFASYCDILAGRTQFPDLAIVVQLIRDAELRALIAHDLIAPRLRMIESILHTAERDGEIDGGEATPLAARIGPALIAHQLLLAGSPPTRRELSRFVDVVLPLPAPASVPIVRAVPRRRS